MLEFFSVVISGGMLPYTGLLGVVLLYWLFVAMTGLEIGEGTLDGAVEGSVDGLIDGAVDGALDGTGGSLEGASHGALGFLSGILHIGTIPATLILTLLVMKAWVLGMVYHLYLLPHMPAWVAKPVIGILFAIVLGIVIFTISIFLTSLTARPFKLLFRHNSVRGYHHLVGKTCVVISSRVTETSGQAECKHDDGFLALKVWSRDPMMKGAEAVIVSYDADRDSYQIKSIT